MTESSTIIAAIDLGTDKIAGAIAAKENDGTIEILALQEEKCKPGTMYRGCAVNTNNTTFHINSIISKLSNEAGVKIKKCIIGYSGTGLLNKKPEYDSTISGCISYLQRSGMQLERCSASHIGLSAEYALNDMEKECGCLFIDFGCGTTSSVVYENGKQVMELTWPAGTSNIISDLRSYVVDEIGYSQFSLNSAEKLFLRFGNATEINPVNDRRIRVAKADGTRPDYFVTEKNVADVVRARLKSNLRIIDRLKAVSWFNRPGRSIVICGGGSRLRNIETFLSEKSEVPVRRADISALFADGTGQQRLAAPELCSLAAILATVNENCKADPEPQQKKERSSKKPKKGILPSLMQILRFDDTEEKI